MKEKNERMEELERMNKEREKDLLNKINNAKEYQLKSIKERLEKEKKNKSRFERKNKRSRNKDKRN